MLDGLLIGALLLRTRSDVKIVANRLLASIPELSQYCIYVEAMDGKDKAGGKYSRAARSYSTPAGRRPPGAVSRRRGGALVVP